MKLKLLICASIQALLLPVTYAATPDDMGNMQNNSPYHNNQIVGKTAGGDNQTTIIDDNGNLKIVEKSKQSSANNPPPGITPPPPPSNSADTPMMKDKPPVHPFKSDMAPNQQNPGPGQGAMNNGMPQANQMPAGPMNSNGSANIQMPPQPMPPQTQDSGQQGPVQGDLQPVPGGAQTRITP